jgi:CHAD domain-containing protein
MLAEAPAPPPPDPPPAGAPPPAEDPAPPPSVRQAHDFLAPALYAMIAEVRRAQDRVAETRGTAGRDPEAIHDFRVALRRLRTVLRPARRVFGKRRLREIGGELRRFAQATGALRDEEVLRETLGALSLPARAQAELTAWLAQRARQERVRRRAVVAVLLSRDGPAGPSLGTALAHLERRIGRRRREAMPAEDLAAAACARAFAEVRALAGAPAGDVAAMHALRIQFKRLRYTAELFAPVLGERAEAVVKSAARMQKRLGELHDVDEALLRVGRARGLSEAGSAALRRALLKARREAVRRARGALGEELAKIAAILPVP